MTHVNLNSDYLFSQKGKMRILLKKRQFRYSCLISIHLDTRIYISLLFLFPFSLSASTWGRRCHQTRVENSCPVSGPLSVVPLVTAFANDCEIQLYIRYKTKYENTRRNSREFNGDNPEKCSTPIRRSLSAPRRALLNFLCLFLDGCFVEHFSLYLSLAFPSFVFFPSFPSRALDQVSSHTPLPFIPQTLASPTFPFFCNFYFWRRIRVPGH